MGKTELRLVIVVRADPVICGHAGEARHLAEAALAQGFSDVRILTWPLEAISASGLPTKPFDSVQPYSPGITVERPPPLGDYKVVDGRYVSGLTGRLVELLRDDYETAVMSMYLHPHMWVVEDAVRTARRVGTPHPVHTVAEAVGSDITNVVRSAIEERRFGAALQLLDTYLNQDLPLAVSNYTRQLIVEAAEALDEHARTSFARKCEERILVSYPAVDAASMVDLDAEQVSRTLEARGLSPDSYLLFLSRLAPAKGADDLIRAYRSSRCHAHRRLVIAGNGPHLAELERLAAGDPNILLLTDVGDDEKLALMHGCSAYVLPSKPQPEFVETFGIALVEKMLVGGGGPVITTRTGGIPEATGDTALLAAAGNVSSLARQLDHAVFELSELERFRLSRQARQYAMRFDRKRIFARICARLPLRRRVERASLDAEALHVV